MRSLAIVFATIGVMAVALPFANAGEKGEKSLFERNHEAIQRAEKRGDVQPRTRPDRFINESERRQMQRLENDPTNK